MTPEMVTVLAAAGGTVVALGAMIVSLFLWLRSDMQQMRAELKGDIGELKDELKGNIGDLERELKEDIKAVDAKVDDLGDKVVALGERMARVEGKLEFLEHFITRQNEPPPVAGE